MFERHLGTALIMLTACSAGTATTDIASGVNDAPDAGHGGAASGDAGAGDGAWDGADDEGDDDAPDGSSGSSSDPTCSTVLKAIVRDFDVHADFENDTFLGQPGAFVGVVAPELGADKKPVHAAAGPTAVTTGPAQFSQWYNDVPGVNQPFEVELPLVEQSEGLYVYDNQMFFPVDNRGFGNAGIDESFNLRNFGFTSEIHTEFDYQGGEVFTFIGDDDLWLFINGKLAIDLGGVHSKLMQSVDLDAQAEALGIAPGNRYAMDIFHAERHSSASTYHIETTIACLIPVVL